MPTVSEVIGGWLQSAVQHPKSTIGSILTVLLFVDSFLLACGCVHGKAAAIAGGIFGTAKIIVGILQKDGINVQLPPGTQVSAKVPDSKS